MLIHGLILSALLLSSCQLQSADHVQPSDDSETRSDYLIGYTEGRNDLPDGQYQNWVTQRAHVVRADGTARQIIGAALISGPTQWTQFAGWSPDATECVVGSLQETPENAAWEKEHRTFRMTEGWLADSCLVDRNTGTVRNVTAVERVSIYNSGLFYLPNRGGYGFTGLIDGISKPFLMDLDGKNKRDVSGDGNGFTYGYSMSPDGSRISYHENYQVYISRPDGSDKRQIETGNPFNFVPTWSPDGRWLLFLSGEHYNCHPCLTDHEGTQIRKLADRGGYRGVVERLRVPDFHSESSDVPVWSPDSRWVYYTAKVGESIELMRVSLDGDIQQLTASQSGVRHYHPAVSPNGKWILFGSDRSGIMQLYVANADGTDAQAITRVAADSCAMHGHWSPIPVSDGYRIP